MSTCTYLLVTILFISTKKTFPSDARTHVLVRTALGSIRSAVDDDTGVVSSLNVPFARPPIGTLRFSPPRPPDPWSPLVLDGTSFGPACAQRNVTEYPNQSEDCLQLNVWTPSLNTSVKKAVLVWVFGGGLVSGSASSFDGTSLATTGDLVVVTTNYRLGALGFYASPELATEGPFYATGSMNGVADVLAALRFVREHIEAWGGDPARVTLAGESSGAVASCATAFSALGDGLWRGLIVESGACTGPWFGPTWSRAASFAASETFAKNATLAELRAAQVETLVAADGFETPNFGVDGYVLSEGRPRDVPPRVDGRSVLLGGNTGDTTCRAANATPVAPKTRAALNATLATYFGTTDAATVSAPYTTSSSDWSEIFYAMSRDAGVTCPTLWLAKRLAAANASNVFLYRFGFDPPTRHGAEVPYVWQDPPNATGATGRFVSRELGLRWTKFARDGTATWPSVSTTANASNLFVDATGCFTTEQDGLARSGHCDAWASYLFANGDAALASRRREKFDAFGYLC